MPTTVADFIDFLKTLPQDAVVRAAKEETIHWETRILFKNLELPHDVFVWEINGQTFVDIGEK